QRGHAPVLTVEAKGTVQEVGGAFAGAADPGELNQIFGDDIQLVTGGNNLAGNGVVTAALAERARVAAVIGFAQASQIKVQPGSCCCLVRHDWFASFSRIDVRTRLAVSGRPSVWAREINCVARSGTSRVSSW